MATEEPVKGKGGGGRARAADATEPTPEAAVSTPAPEQVDDADEPVESIEDGMVVTHRVLKPFEAEGVWREHGELLNASGWRTVRSLEAIRHLAPVHAAPDAVICDCCSRVWLDEAARRNHIIAAARAKHEAKVIADQAAEDVRIRASEATSITDDAMSTMSLDVSDGLLTSTS